MVNVAKRTPPPVGGQFEFQGGYGVVITPDKAVIYIKADEEILRKIRGKVVNYGGYTFNVDSIPPRTFAIDNDFIPVDVRLALESVSSALTEVYKEFKFL